MEAQIISIKQLHCQLKKVSEDVLRGKSFMVIRNSKPVFKIEPLENVKAKKYTIKDLEKIQFRDADKNLSEKIDKIVYKI